MIQTGSKLAERFWETGKLGCPIIDFHAHMHEHSALYFPYTDAAGMAHTMDRCGTKLTIFCSHLAMYDPREGEEIQRRAVRAFPEHFKAYHGVISQYADADQFVKDMEQYPDIYAGAKFFCGYYDTKLTDPLNTPYLEYLNEHHMLALMHTWGGDNFCGPDEVRKAAERYPNITFIAGHSFFDGFDYAHDQLIECKNVFYELTAVPIERGFIETICEKDGSERLLFGSDLPWFATSHSIGCVLGADLTDEDRENIFWRNGDRILRRFNWYQPEL